MNRQFLISFILKNIESELSSAHASFASLQTARNEAPSAMQSHSDTTRFQLEKNPEESSRILQTLENTKRFLEEKGESFPILITEENGTEKIFAVLPTEYGAEYSVESKPFFIVSEHSPVGAKLLFSKTGEHAEIRAPKRTRTLYIKSRVA